MKYAALLRGINVGGKNLLPMKDLAAMFSKAGCSDVSTYIQSGNVVFGAAKPLAAKIPSLVGLAITKKFGFEVPILVRSHDELADIAGNNPHLSPGADTTRLLVMFLADKPKDVTTLDPQRSPPDEFVVRGREIYLRCPNGFGRSKLSNAWFDSKLKTVSTGRNWNTLLKLIEMTR